MNLNKLKERTSFILGDLDYPTPNKLCLVKLTDSYLKRSNRIFFTKYVVGFLELKGKKAFLVDSEKIRKYSYNDRSCTWSSNIIEQWYYIEDIEEKLKEIKK